MAVRTRVVKFRMLRLEDVPLRRVLLLGAAVLAVLAGTAAARSSEWSAPVAVSERLPSCVPAKCATFPQLVMNARGDAAAVWRRYFGFEMSRPFGFDCSLAVRRPGGSWSAPEPAPGGACPSIALDPSGNVIAAWVAVRGGRRVVLAQVRTPAGRWLRGQRISRPDADASSPHVVAGARGAVAVWLSEKGGRYSLEAAVAGSSGRFGAPRTVGSAPGSTSVRIAVNARGDATVGWSTFVGGRDAALAAFRPAGGRWQAPQTLARSSGIVGTPAVALDPSGDAIAVWSEYDSRTGSVLRSAFRPAGGRFGRDGVIARSGAGPEVAFDARGNALAVWWGTGGGGEQAAVAAMRAADGTWRAPQVISSPGVRVGLPASALAPTGDAIAVWIRFGVAGPGGRMDAVQAAVRPAGGRFGAPRDISREGLLGATPQVAVDARGNAVVIWEGTDGVIEAATYAK